MVKSITSAGNLVKTVAMSALLAGSVALGATNPVKTTKQNSIPNQTEVVSKDGAEAVKVMTLPQQPKPAVPTVHNKKLDDKFLNFCETEEDKRIVNDFISNTYKQSGSYLGSATIQQNLDLNAFLAFLNGDIEILKNFDEEAYNKIDRDAMKQVVEKSEPIKQWLNENYFNAYNEPFGQFDHPPDAEEVSQALDKYVNEDPNDLFGRRLVEDNYNFTSRLLRRSLEKTNLDKIQKDTYSIAHKVHCADHLMFSNLLKVIGMDLTGLNNPIKNNFLNFMYAVDPAHDIFGD